MKLWLAVALAAFLSFSAGADTITSVKPGFWDTVSTWDGGIPSASDSAIVLHKVQTKKTAFTAEYISIGAAGTLEITRTDSVTTANCGDIDVTGTLDLDEGAKLRFVVAPASDAQVIEVKSGGRIEQRPGCNIEVSNTVGDGQPAVVVVEQGGFWSAQGRILGTGTVLGMTPGVRPGMTVTFGDAVPEGTTHIRVVQGWFKGTVHIVSQVVSSSAILADGLIDDGMVVAAAARDSVSFDAANQANELNANGSVLSVRSPGGTGLDWGNPLLIETFFTNTSEPVAFTENDPRRGKPATSTLVSVDDEAIVTEALYVGVRVEFVKAAQLWGRQAIDLDPSNLGSVDILGGCDLQNLVFRYLGNSQRGGGYNNQAILFAASDDSKTFKNCASLDQSADYVAAWYDEITGTVGPTSFDFDGFYCARSWEAPDGDNGHFLRIDDSDFEDAIQVRNTASRGTNDDWCHLVQAVSLRVYDNWAAAGDSVNMANFIAVGGPSSTVETFECSRNQSYGNGEPFLFLNAGTMNPNGFTWGHNKIVRGGNAFHRTLADNHDETSTQAVAHFASTANMNLAGRVTCDSDTVLWATIRTAAHSPDESSPSWLFKGLRYYYNGVWHDQDALGGTQGTPVSISTQLFGSFHYNGLGANELIVQDSEFIDHVRRGGPIDQANSASGSFYVQGSGNSGRVFVFRSRFEDYQAWEEAQRNSIFPDVPHIGNADADLEFMEVVNSTFIGRQSSIYFLTDMRLVGNVFWRLRAGGTAANNRVLDAASNYNFLQMQYNTVVVDTTAIGAPLIDGVAGSSPSPVWHMKNNVFVCLSPNVAAIDIAAANRAFSVFDYNVVWTAGGGYSATDADFPLTGWQSSVGNWILDDDVTTGATRQTLDVLRFIFAGETDLSLNEFSPGRNINPNAPAGYRDAGAIQYVQKDNTLRTGF